MKSVRPKKFLGQHFLNDLHVAQDIADTVDACPDIPILEVGPGMGVLTQFLLVKGRPVKVVELDFESVAYLKENFSQMGDNIIEQDFLRMDLRDVFGGEPFVLTGNYPYNISSQIFFKMLDNSRADSRRSGEQVVWHPERTDSGMVQGGVSVYRA